MLRKERERCYLLGERTHLSPAPKLNQLMIPLDPPNLSGRKNIIEMVPGTLSYRVIYWIKLYQFRVDNTAYQAEPVHIRPAWPIEQVLLIKQDWTI